MTLKQSRASHAVLHLYKVLQYDTLTCLKINLNFLVGYGMLSEDSHIKSSNKYNECHVRILFGSFCKTFK